MMHPLFTYPVKNTTWYIVVAKGASHFYFDSATRTSVWQLSDTDIESLEGRVNFDDLALLFAKANGLNVGQNGQDQKKRKNLDARQLLKSRRIDELLSDMGPGVSETDPGLSNMPIGINAEVHGTFEEAAEEQDFSLKEAKETEQRTAGLDLGYSSSEDADDSGNEGFHSNTELATLRNDDSDDENVNGGLDLAFDDDGETSECEALKTARDDFRRLLDEYQDEISINDPWFLVEEELVSSFSQHPAFYGIPDSAAREKIYDEWVASQDSTNKQTQVRQSVKYPTSKLLFFLFLQNHKPEVRKLFFPEFCKKHTAEVDAFRANSPNLDLENLYREMRVTLNDYAEFERAEKKRKVEGNLKVAHVEDYLRRTLAGFCERHAERRKYHIGDTGHFDLWMQLCNQYNLPERVVGDATNFVVGDEKRLSCYLRVMGLS